MVPIPCLLISIIIEGRVWNQILVEYCEFTSMSLVPDLVPVGCALVPGWSCSKIAVNSSIWALVPGLVPIGSGWFRGRVAAYTVGGGPLAEGP